MRPSTRDTRKRRKLIKLWYQVFGPYCVFCEEEMDELGKAFAFNSRTNAFLAKLPKEERATPPSHPTIDHIVPKAMGGSDAMKNYVVACSKCNNEKGADGSSYPIRPEVLLVWFEAIDKLEGPDYATKNPNPTIQGVFP